MRFKSWCPVSCQEMRRLEEAQKLHGEAALYLGCEATGPRKAIPSNKMLARLCRADKARAFHAIVIHRRDCPTCKEPSYIPHQ